MFPENGKTAESAAKIFLDNMAKHNDWSDSVLTAVKNLESETEQLTFLKWMADPSGKFREVNKDCKLVKNTNEIDLKNLEISRGDPGKFPSYKLTVKNSLEEDQKYDE
jgi:hypothetical protein